MKNVLTFFEKYEYAVILLLIVLSIPAAAFLLSINLKREQKQSESDYKAKESFIFTSTKKDKIGKSNTSIVLKNVCIGYAATSRESVDSDKEIIDYVKAFDRINRDPRYAGVQSCTVYSKVEIDSAIRICYQLGALPTTTALGINDSPFKK